MKQMDIILRADVDNLGSLGDLVTVKAGYARNYLLPQGLAMKASESNKRKFDNERKRLEKLNDERRAVANELAEKIESTPLSMEVRVGENDKLYGSVTVAMIGDELADKGIDIDRKKIQLDAPIRALGSFDLEVKLHPEIRATLHVDVVRQGGPLDEEVQVAGVDTEGAAEDAARALAEAAGVDPSAVTPVSAEDVAEAGSEEAAVEEVTAESADEKA